MTDDNEPGEPADLQASVGAALRPSTALSSWLGLAALLFLGWVVVMPFMAAGPVARPMVIVATGLVFSATTATIMARIFRTRTDAVDSAPTAAPAERTIFAYPLAFRRLLRFGLVFCPLLLALNIIGFAGGLGKSSPTFIVGMIVFGAGFVLNVYVVANLVGEVRVSSHGLDVRMVSGRSTSIGWSEIVDLRIGPHRNRLRVETKAGAGFSVESSLPGYTQLLRLLERRSERLRNTEAGRS